LARGRGAVVLSNAACSIPPRRAKRAKGEGGRPKADWVGAK
jgi:hypothetical protein